MKTHSPDRLEIPKPRALGLAIALAFCAAPAIAQDATVFISGFNWTTSTGADLLWSDPFQSITATSQNGGGFFGSQTQTLEGNNYNPGIGFATVSHAFTTYSAAGDQTFFLTAATTPSVGPIGTPRNQSTATGLQSGVFSLDGGDAGSVTFTVDYMLAVKKPGGNPVTDFSTAFVHFNAMSDNNLSGNDLSAQLASFNQLGGTRSSSGHFTITVSLLADEVGFYTLDGRAESFAVATIPEPQEWALLLAGFAGLGAYVRKRKTPEPA